MLQLAPRQSFGQCRRRLAAAGTAVSDTRLGPAADLPVHGHAAAYACVVLSGEHAERAERFGRPADALRCTAGTVVAHPAGHVHANTVGAAGARCVNIELDLALLGDGPARALGGWLASGRHVDLGANAAPLARLAAALEDADLDDLGPLRVHAAALELLCAAARVPATRATSASRACCRVIERLEAALSAREAAPDLDTLAAEAGVHPHHLMRVFKAAQGETVGAYVLRRRLEIAASALRGSDRAIADIAVEAGFCDQSHFTRAFRRRYGATPGSLRA